MNPLSLETRFWVFVLVVAILMLPSGRVPAAPDWSGSAASPAVSPSGDHSSRIPLHKEKNRG